MRRAIVLGLIRRPFVSTKRKKNVATIKSKWLMLNLRKSALLPSLFLCVLVSCGYFDFSVFTVFFFPGPWDSPDTSFYISWLHVSE